MSEDWKIRVDVRDKRISCRGCGKLVKRSLAANSKYCTLSCQVKHPRKTIGCMPCLDENRRYRTIVHKNGSRHTQAVCNVCGRTKLVPAFDPEVTPEGMNGEFSRIYKERTARYGDSFYNSTKWQRLRFDTLRRYGGQCTLCGSTRSPHVDHIKPRSLRPDLALDPSNLQILCAECNLGKGNRDSTDFRGLRGSKVTVQYGSRVTIRLSP